MATRSQRVIPTVAADALARAFHAGDPMDELHGIQDLREVLDQRELELVNEMRLAGCSWDAIAGATHLNSRQRAHQKFSELRLTPPAQ